MNLTIVHAISVVNLKGNIFFPKFLVGLWKTYTFSSGLTMVMIWTIFWSVSNMSKLVANILPV